LKIPIGLLRLHRGEDVRNLLIFEGFINSLGVGSIKALQISLKVFLQINPNPICQRSKDLSLSLLISQGDIILFKMADSFPGYSHSKN
jgi:hypothetical protein